MDDLYNLHKFNIFGICWREFALQNLPEFDDSPENTGIKFLF